MSKFCPVIQQKVVYLTCLECEHKVCKSRYSADDTFKFKERKDDGRSSDIDEFEQVKKIRGKII